MNQRSTVPGIIGRDERHTEAERESRILSFLIRLFNIGSFVGVAGLIYIGGRGIFW